MGSSWSGFLPQNDIIKLQWAVLEGCQTDVAAKALSALLGKTANGSLTQTGDEADQSEEEPEDDSWPAAEFGVRRS